MVCRRVDSVANAESVCFEAALQQKVQKYIYIYENMHIPHHIVQVQSRQRFPIGSVAVNNVNHWEIILAAFRGFAAIRPVKSARLGGKGTNVVIFYLDVFPKLGIYVGLLRG